MTNGSTRRTVLAAGVAALLAGCSEYGDENDGAAQRRPLRMPPRGARRRAGPRPARNWPRPPTSRSAAARSSRTSRSSSPSPSKATSRPSRRSAPTSDARSPTSRTARSTAPATAAGSASRTPRWPTVGHEPAPDGADRGHGRLDQRGVTVCRPLSAVCSSPGPVRRPRALPRPSGRPGTRSCRPTP
jgi:hypothetical protein